MRLEFTEQNSKPTTATAQPRRKLWVGSRGTCPSNNRAGRQLMPSARLIPGAKNCFCPTNILIKFTLMLRSTLALNPLQGSQFHSVQFSCATSTACSIAYIYNVPKINLAHSIIFPLIKPIKAAANGTIGLWCCLQHDKCMIGLVINEK